MKRGFKASILLSANHAFIVLYVNYVLLYCYSLLNYVLFTHWVLLSTRVTRFFICCSLFLMFYSIWIKRLQNALCSSQFFTLRTMLILFYAICIISEFYRCKIRLILSFLILICEQKISHNPYINLQDFSFLAPIYSIKNL